MDRKSISVKTAEMKVPSLSKYHRVNAGPDKSWDSSPMDPFLLFGLFSVCSA